MQSGPRRGTMGRPDPYYSQPRQSFKGGPPGFKPPAPGYGSDPSYGVGAPNPMMMQPNGGSFNFDQIAQMLSWAMILSSLAFTGTVVAAVADMGIEANTFLFGNDIIPLNLAMAFTASALLNIVKGKFQSEAVKTLALASSGVALFASLIVVAIAAKKLDDYGDVLDDKPKGYLYAVTVAMGIHALLSLGALIAGLGSLFHGNQQPIPIS